MHIYGNKMINFRAWIPWETFFKTNHETTSPGTGNSVLISVICGKQAGQIKLALLFSRTDVLYCKVFCGKSLCASFPSHYSSDAPINPVTPSSIPEGPHHPWSCINVSFLFSFFPQLPNFCCFFSLCLEKGIIQDVSVVTSAEVKSSFRLIVLWLVFFLFLQLEGSNACRFT